MFGTRAAKKSAGALAILFVLSSAAQAKHPLSIISAFDDEAEGIYPSVGAIDGDGNLYGTTFQGGGLGTCSNGGCGTLFKLSPDGTRTLLHTFSGPDGYEPTGTVRDAAGNIYGATVGGGRHGYGAVFKYTPGGRFSLIYSFPAPDNHNDAPKGIWPTSGLTLGMDGNLYGTASHGGINNQCGTGGCGTVFRITPHGKFTRLYAFRGAGDGCSSEGGVAVDAAGNVYGTTQGCGYGNYGTVYRIDPSGTETVLHVFQEGLDGNNPTATPVLDEAGNVYGGTISGGGDGCGGVGVIGPGCGILYKIAPDGTETILHAFKGALEGGDGAIVEGVYLDAKGNLYGTTGAGGTPLACGFPFGCGTIFKFAPDGTETVLHRFLGPQYGDGVGPSATMIPAKDKDGTTVFYGAAARGPQCCGMLFKIQK